MKVNGESKKYRWEKSYFYKLNKTFPKLIGKESSINTSYRGFV